MPTAARPLRAVAPLLGDGGHAVVIGDGPDAAALAGLAASLPVAPFLHLLGRRMVASVLLVQALGGGWNADDLPSGPALVAN
mgnify:CR=1 FL=1